MPGFFSVTAIEIVMTWQAPVLKSLKLECSCWSGMQHCTCPCMTVCTGVGKWLHTLPSHSTWANLMVLAEECEQPQPPLPQSLAIIRILQEELFRHTWVEETAIHLIWIVPTSVSIVTHQPVVDTPAVITLELPHAWVGCTQIFMFSQHMFLLHIVLL